MSEIKVIRDATKDIYQVKCSACSSMLEFTYDKEVRALPSSKDSDREYSYWIVCPCCGKHTKTRLKRKGEPIEDYRFNVTQTRGQNNKESLEQSKSLFYGRTIVKWDGLE